MTDEQYPYLQTLTGLEDGVKAYAIQPVGENETAERAEENPLFAFGPLGAINIFVGATNAGKRRFMRSLLKAESYQFHTKESHQAVSDLRNCLRYLLNSQESFRFGIEDSGRNSDGSLIALDSLPDWAKTKLSGIAPGIDYDLLIDAKLFTNLETLFQAYLLSHFSTPDAEPILTVPSGSLDAWQMAVWVKDLLKGEEAVRSADPERGKGGHYVTQTNQSLRREYLRHFTFPFDSVSAEWRKNFVQFTDACEYFSQPNPTAPEVPPQRIYIPTLRSAVSLSDESGKRLDYDVFEKTVRNNYGLKDKGIDVFSGNRLYDTLRRDKTGPLHVRNKLREFEKFLSEAFYEGRGVEIAPIDEFYNAGQHISVDVQGDSPRELHHLGDGINTLIILLYQLFMAEPGSWVFIEEPELNLHPGLQRLFLQTLLENEALQKQKLRVFFTTHSNHLLRMTLRDGTIASEDISIFAFQQRETNKEHFLIRPLVTEHHDALALLGVQNASVLLAQCGIWAEGVTDRQYVRAYLNAYQNSDEFKKDKQLRTLREDTHFAFWEYAGSNLAHYLMDVVPNKDSEEAEEYERGKKEVLAQIQSSALCNRIFLMADRDTKKDKKHNDLKNAAQGRSNFQYYVTPCIEIENLLSPEEIAALLPKFFNEKTPVPFDFKQADYKNIGIGTFLNEKYPGDFKAGWAADSGTLTTYHKNRFCKLAIEHISWDSMSNEAKALTKALHQFISKHNNI